MFNIPRNKAIKPPKENLAKRFTLGQKITITRKLIREFCETSRYYPPGHWKTIWKVEELEKPIEGFVIGIRTLSNGNVNYDPESGNVFTPTEYIRAILVVYNINKKPFLVPVD